MKVNGWKRKAVLISGVSFALHGVWEIVVCTPFYASMGEGEIRAWLQMLRATIGDVVLTWGAWAVLALISRDVNWPFKRWRLRQWFGLEVPALVFSMAVEWVALVSGAWDYRPAMPRIPGLNIGFVPVLQLAVLFPVTFLIGRRLLRRT